MPEKEKSKMGPREQQLREMREARIDKNKRLIDKKSKPKLSAVPANKMFKKPSGRGR
jgi:hypothetical protein